ncbi:MAG: hypothetical protein IT341_05740 [Chloroflexi bacterium]|nr:hypothetical protein [Chloroflexota bacterium]
MLRKTHPLLAIVAAGLMAMVMLVPVLASGGYGQGPVRRLTAPFHNFRMAQAAGYSVEVADKAGITCIEDPGGTGGMGIHYLNPALLGNEINATSPELLIFEPGRHGRLHLVAVEYLVMQADWDAVHASPPELFGQAFSAVGADNRYGLPPFYELHAWIWKRNPNGMFADYNPRVDC